MLLISLTLNIWNDILDCMNKKQLILFDDDCLFCNGAVKFIEKRDSEDVFMFAGIKSILGQAFMEHYRLMDKSDTFALIGHDNCLTMSDAVLSIVDQLDGAWPLLGMFRIIPKKIRDLIYTSFGKYRYRLFGKADECSVPSRDLIKKFAGDLSIEQWKTGQWRVE